MSNKCVDSVGMKIFRGVGTIDVYIDRCENID